jgi:hypothetical protein
MAEIKDAVQSVRTDARTLWLPIGVVLVVFMALFGGVVTATTWVVKTNDKAASTTVLAEKMDALNTQIATMQGSINALMQMQSTVAETKAAVSGLESRLDAMETRLQTQTAWMLTTRERLKDQGFETPPIDPGGN